MGNQALIESVKRLSSSWYKNLSLIQNEFVMVSNCFYEKNGYMQMSLPITTSCISSPMGLGSDSLPVKISMFGIDTYLADSMQFMLEYGCRMHNCGCYYIMPSFRGEQADNRHLSQFVHSEAEIPGTLEDVMKIIENYLFFLNENMLSKCINTILQMTDSVAHVNKLTNGYSIPKTSYLEMLNLIKQAPDGDSMVDYINGCKYPNINSKGGKFILDQFDGAVWLMYFPEDLVPFYQAIDKNEELALNADLLLGYGEVVGCGQRHKNIDDVYKSLKRHQVNPEPYEWYMQMKQEYPLQTSGFGMGMERYLLWLLNCDDIRKLQILNRDNGKVFVP